ncbi:tetraspanin-8-like isoform X2 [Oncorhynchus tshawytscha]|uniref:tetraspanin-8-like isoform X2 n=1 Tax=Oncorhynchus tshawytscha TaxID=74940 RepID=UPI001C3DD11A|nr:tetraspanin-8-like isoform X2 [Oncorhynchus tshawytscha]
MGRIHICVKRTFIFVCVLIGIISTLLLAITLFGHGYFHQSEEIEDILPGIVVLYVLEAATLVLSIFGVYGARKEKKWAVVLFSVGMSLASLYLFVECVNGYQSKHEMEELTREEHLAMMPLSGANQTDLEGLYNMQTNLKCCGLVQGYQDWGTDIPLSCLCSDEDSTDFTCVAPGNNTRFVIHYPNSDLSEDDDHKGLMDEHMLVYKEDVGVVLAITILCQMRRKVDVPPVIFTSQPPQYRELCDTAESV